QVCPALHGPLGPAFVRRGHPAHADAAGCVSSSTPHRPWHDARSGQVNEIGRMTIHLEGIKKTYSSGFTAVNNLDLRIEKGEFFTLLGPSGCAKSTRHCMSRGWERGWAGRT